MLFNTFNFLLIFLPVTVCGYFVINTLLSHREGKLWLIACSFVFYGYWNILYVPILALSIITNYHIGNRLRQGITSGHHSSKVLAIGIGLNLSLLAYFKYTNFMIDNINALTGSTISISSIALPLGISFYTFQQIAYLVDCHKTDIQGHSFIDYSLFVSFFPQLVAGPIVKLSEMLPQISRDKQIAPNRDNIFTGIYIIIIGLCKKNVIADNLSAIVQVGHDSATSLTVIEAWTTSLAYTFQLYFDFSGYMDIALGSALLLNIKIPINFNSPYRATSIRDFWHRWHITLGRFLKNYIYIPLRGNRRGLSRTCINLFATFFLAGVWHGAGWTFIVWGTMHALAIVIHRLWHEAGLKMPAIAGWLLTFLFINFSWIFFRAEDISTAFDIAGAMLGSGGLVIHSQLEALIPAISSFNLTSAGIMPNTGSSFFELLGILFVMALCFLPTNSHSLQHKFNYGPRDAFILTGGLMALMIISSERSEFIYFIF